MSNRKRILFIILPVLLILSTSVVFYTATLFFGRNWGYITGFFFYYIIWCLIIPLTLTRRKFLNFFKSESSFLKWKNWWIVILFASTVISPVFMFFIPKFASINPWLILLAVPLSIIHGHCEELFWRGLYVKEFPGSIVWSIIVPSVFFTLWHIAPQFSIRSEHPVIFIISTIPLGVTYAIVSFVTKSAGWSAAGHAISTFFAFSLPISLCILNIIG